MRFLMPFARQASSILSATSASSRSGGSSPRAARHRARGSCDGDVDAALLGLTDLPDEVAAVVAARRATDDLEVLRLQLLDRHRREPTARLRRRALGERRRLGHRRRALAGARQALRLLGGRGLDGARANASSMRRTELLVPGSWWSPRRLLETLPQRRSPRAARFSFLDFAFVVLVFVLVDGCSPRRALGTRRPSRAPLARVVGLRP